MRYEYSVIYPPDEHGHFLMRPLVEIDIFGPQGTLFTDIVITLPPAKTLLRIPVGCIESPYVGVLLGQEGFFDQHRIAFTRSHGVFTVNRITQCKDYT